MSKLARPPQQLRFSASNAPNPSATPHRRVPTSSNSTIDNRPNRSTDPGAKPVHTDNRAHCSGARTTVRQPPYAGTHHSQQGPGRHHHSPPATHHAHQGHTPSNATPNSITTRLSPRDSQYYRHTHARPSPEDLNASKVNPTGPSGTLTIYTYSIFRCTGRVPGQPGPARPPGTPRPRPHELHPETPNQTPPQRA